MSADLPLRERKKLQTRQHLVDTAAALFHARGFDAVTVADVARAAEVGEQTVYNYFATKERLVFDEADAFAQRFAAMISETPAGAPLGPSVAREVHAFLDGLASRPADANPRGGMPYLIATNATVRRGWLNLVERFSRIIADAILVRDDRVAPGAAAVAGWAIMGVFVLIVDATGCAERDGEPVEVFLARLRPQVEGALEFLGRGLDHGGLPS